MGSTPYIPGQFSNDQTQQPAQPQQQAPQQLDPNEQALRQSLVQQATPPPHQPSSGIKGLLQNFFQGGGNAVLHEVGLPTQYDIQQRALQNLNAYDSNQAMLQLHRNMAQQLQLTPVQLGDGSTVNVAQKDVAGLLNRMMQGASSANVANITGSYRMAALLAGSAAVTQDDIDKYNLPPEFLGKRIKPSEISGLQRSQNSQQTVVQGESGPSLVNKQTKQITPLGLGNPSMGRPMQVGNPNAPGETMTVTGRTAVNQNLPGPQSASVQVPRQAAKAEVPTKIGDQRIAFQTMIDHASLLRNAARALNNGDVQALNGLTNSFKNAFGYSGPITAEAIADAYKGEVTSVINKGHITDIGSEKVAHTLDPTRQNYATIDSVLGAYQGLAQSKMNNLNAQKQSAISQSQPRGNAPTGGFAAWKASQK